MPGRNNSRNNKNVFKFKPEPDALKGIHLPTGEKVTKKNIEGWVKSESIKGKTLEEQARELVNPHTGRNVTRREFEYGITGVKRNKFLEIVANEGEIPERKTWKGPLEVAAIKEDTTRSKILHDAEENKLNVEEFTEFLYGDGSRHTLFSQEFDQGQNTAENSPADEQHDLPANAR